MNKHKHIHGPHWHRKLNVLVTSLVLITVGLMFLGRNMGWVSWDIFHIVVSWQMLLIVIGVASLLKRNLIGGLILITVGAYFLVPYDFGLGSYWPVLLILIGFAILTKLRRPRGETILNIEKEKRERGAQGSGDGFVTSDVSFGSSRHIVLDPVFRGAALDVAFGSIILDLRHTQLEGSQTFIDTDCSFGSTEIYIPSHWNVILRANTTFGGIVDKRYVTQEIDYSHQLIIRGDITFGGVEIKS